MVRWAIASLPYTRGRVVVKGLPVPIVDRVCDGGTKSVHVQAVSPRPVRDSLKA
jgi:hypothetical protein